LSACVKQFNGGHSDIVGTLPNLAQQAAIVFVICSSAYSHAAVLTET